MGRASSGRAFAPRTAPRGQQRGIAAIFAAVSLVTLLSAVALSIDIGRLYFADRNLQRLADLAAIDGARVQSQCLGPAALDEVAAEVAASLQRNGLPPGTNVVTELGLRRNNGSGLQVFTPSNPSQAADAVRVTLSRTSPARILPLFSGEERSTLTSRAAASSELVKSVEISPGVRAGVESLQPEYFGAALGARLNLGSGGSLISGTEATVSLAELTRSTSEVTDPVPDVTELTEVDGLLTDLENLLNESGDLAAARLVSAYAFAAGTGREGVRVLPSDVLGLPTQGSYDGATATVGGILSAITDAVSQGEVIQLPPLCDLLPLEQLPTFEVLPGLCDSTFEINKPQPGRIRTTNNSTEVLDLDTSSDNAATSSSALIRVRLKLQNPLNNQPINLPLNGEAQGAAATVRAVSCARAGQPVHQVTVDAQAPTVRFALGDSAGFTAAMTSPSADVGSLLDDVEPAVVLTATLRDVLTNAGLGVVANNPLFAGVVGQTVTVRAGVAPFTVGSGERATFCMEGSATEAVTTQCNGAPARVGGVTPPQALSQVEGGLGAVTLSVQLPASLPPLLATPVQQAVDALTDELSTQLANALKLLAPQLLKVSSAVNVAVGEAQVTLGTVKVSPPEVFAR